MKEILHQYSPRGTCLELMRARDKEVLMSGPAGTGKSRACLEKLNACALKYPGMRGLIIRKTQVSLASTALETWRKFVIAEALQAGFVTWYGGSDQEAPQYRYNNGSKILIGGMDKATKIMSSEYDIVFAQEAIELRVDDWEAVLTRLRNGVMPYQQIIADTNPDSPSHWLMARHKSGILRMLPCTHEDNPVLFGPDGKVTARGREYMSLLDSLTGVRKQRLRHGLWVAAEGMIYQEQWSPDYLIDPKDIPRSWDRYWSIDFGFNNPFVCQVWARDPDDNLYLTREIYRTQRLVEDHARDLKALIDSGQESAPVAVVCDHDAEGRATLERHLCRGTVAAHKAVKDGIQLVQARMLRGGLKMFRGSVATPDPTLEQAKKPTCTYDEIAGYVWQVKDGVATEEPVKENDHGMDAMRYMVAQVDKGGRPGLRWL